jgi:hypothetical protein
VSNDNEPPVFRAYSNASTYLPPEKIAEAADEGRLLFAQSDNSLIGAARFPKGYALFSLSPDWFNHFFPTDNTPCCFAVSQPDGIFQTTMTDHLDKLRATALAAWEMREPSAIQEIENTGLVLVSVKTRDGFFLGRFVPRARFVLSLYEELTSIAFFAIIVFVVLFLLLSLHKTEPAPHEPLKTMPIIEEKIEMLEPVNDLEPLESAEPGDLPETTGTATSAAPLADAVMPCGSGGEIFARPVSDGAVSAVHIETLEPADAIIQKDGVNYINDKLFQDKETVLENAYNKLKELAEEVLKE